MNARFKELWWWLVDYLYTLRGYARMIFCSEPASYRAGHESHEKCIVLIPGLSGKWQALKNFGDELSRVGYPVNIIPDLGFGMKSIEESAKLIRAYTEKNDIWNVVLLAHSKGGLIGKYLLVHYNRDGRFRKLIALATPFAGSRLAVRMPFRAYRELEPGSSVVDELSKNEVVNSAIVSIYGTFDNHIWPQESAFLPSAKNMRVAVNGHTKILFDTQVIEIVKKEIEKV